MTLLLAFISAMVISMSVIPLMVRMASRLGMIDKPGPRKVHTTPIPRVGGIGIVLGALAPILFWAPMNQAISAYLLGALVLLVFGIWDDVHELRYHIKFFGQFIAVLLVVFYGNVYVDHLPLLNLETIPAYVGKPFTVLVMVGLINALNTSDGLDGLAGGMSLLSFACIGYMAFMEGGFVVLIITTATVGGVFGFLRYNTHPARVFMGDGGSQFLGFTLGFLAVLLTHEVNPVLSPALPALILGLPVIDILAVIVQRTRRGTKWYHAHKDHIHHRLLRLGFGHHEAVVIIYSIQILFVVSAIILSYESDVMILSLYLGVCTLLFLFLTIAEHSGWQAHKSHKASMLARTINVLKENNFFTTGLVFFVAVAIPLIFIFVSFYADMIPRDIGIVSGILTMVMLLFLFFGRRSDSIFIQAVIYVVAAFVIYLETEYLVIQTPFMEMLELAYLGALVIAIGLTIRYAGNLEFRTTPMDYLVIFVVLSAGILLHNRPEQADFGAIAVKLIIIFYGCELIIMRMKSRWNTLNISTLATLAVLSIRGLF